MSVRNFALIFGILFLVTGIAGFIPGLLMDPGATAPALSVHHGSGMLLGLFPTNIVHDLVHVLFGVWGIAVYRSFGGALTYARAVAVIYALLTVMGLIPALSTTFGLVPLYGYDIALHAAIAVVAAYFGFVKPREVVSPTPRHA